MADKQLRWKLVSDYTGSQPKPRHGHRAVAIRDLIIMFGGGNEVIIDGLHVYNTTTDVWFEPIIKGDIPPARASYGLVADGSRLLMFGGMLEYQKYSSDLYELETSKWKWQKLEPKAPEHEAPPCGRLGHSFTLLMDKVYLFGGLANDSKDPYVNIRRYLNDLYVLDIGSKPMHWKIPTIHGTTPPPRESHTGVAYTDRNKGKSFLVIYGGMSGCRLSDLWLLNIDSLTWDKPVMSGLVPPPRSLHTSTLIGHRMFVFGGWIPASSDDSKTPSRKGKYKCTGTMVCFNLETRNWDDLIIASFDGTLPCARAGHCAVGINSRLYVWSGRDEFRREGNKQVCFEDLWYIDVDKPPAPGKISAVQSSPNSLDIVLSAVPGTKMYILQILKVAAPRPAPKICSLPPKPNPFREPAVTPAKTAPKGNLPTAGVTLSKTGATLQQSADATPKVLSGIVGVRSTTPEVNASNSSVPVMNTATVSADEVDSGKKVPGCVCECRKCKQKVKIQNK